jgi:hypothetical protein
MTDVDPRPKVAKADVAGTPPIQKNAVSDASLAKSKPLAAYLLGYNSLTVRLWQLLFWLWRGQLNTEDSVPGALEELREAAAALSDETPENLSRKLTDVCKEITAITLRGPFVPKGREHDFEYWFKAEKSTGHAKWKALVSLSKSALPEKSPWQPWFQLGEAIANYQIELFIQNYYGDRRGAPSLQPVLDCAAELSEQGYGTVREIKRLVRTMNRPWSPQAKILGEVVETPDCDLDRRLDSVDKQMLLSRQMIELNSRIQLALREMRLAPKAGRQGRVIASGQQKEANEPAAVNWREGYLGLQFDDDHHQVTRRGCDPVRPPRLLWGLLLALEANQDRNLPESEVAKVWPEWGRAKKVNRPTITAAIDELEDKLKTLGISIESIRNKGWRLSANDAPKAQ